jgi:hypothetical protein
MERLVDPALIGVESAAEVERENDLARQSLRPPSCCGCACAGVKHAHSVTSAGTTRSRVTFFHEQIPTTGVRRYNGDTKVHSSLLNVVLRD